MWVLAIPGMGLLSLFVFLCSFIPIMGCVVSRARLLCSSLSPRGIRWPARQGRAGPPRAHGQACSRAVPGNPTPHPQISTVPIGFVALTEYGFVKLALVIAMVLVVHAVEAYALNPAIYSANLKLHPLMVRPAAQGRDGPAHGSGARAGLAGRDTAGSAWRQLHELVGSWWGGGGRRAVAGAPAATAHSRDGSQALRQHRPEPSTAPSDVGSVSSSDGEQLPAQQTTRSGRTSRPSNRHVPSPGKLLSDATEEYAARRASGEVAAAKRQRAAERACRAAAVAAVAALYQAAAHSKISPSHTTMTMGSAFLTGAQLIGTTSQMPLNCCGGAMQRPTQCGWTAAEPAPATSSTATCARRGTPISGATGPPRAVPTAASHRTTVSARPARRPWPPAAWTRSSTASVAAVWSTSARTAHAAQMGAKVRAVLRVLLPLARLGGASATRKLPTATDLLSLRRRCSPCCSSRSTTWASGVCYWPCPLPSSRCGGCRCARSPACSASAIPHRMPLPSLLQERLPGIPDEQLVG
jgi:hypothetical protein